MTNSLAALVLSTTPAAGTQICLTERVSVDSNGNQANGDSNSINFSSGPSISQDGRYVAFTSRASNLVAGDTNGFSDVFVHDRTTGQTERVSVSSAGAQALDSSDDPSISSGGRFVAFKSTANNLVPGDTYPYWDAFVHDRLTGQTTRVSVDSNGGQATSSGGFSSPSISADGRFVAFFGLPRLAPGDTNFNTDVFVHDTATGQTELVSVDSNGSQGSGWVQSPSISSDGRLVAFTSTSPLVPGDTNGSADVFVHDRLTGQTTRVSVDSNGGQASGSIGASISSDGRYIAFVSAASNLVSGDTNGVGDVFVHDRVTGQTTRVSVGSGGGQGDDLSRLPSISSDGRFVAFESAASNLVAGDTNGLSDAFVHDRLTGQTTRVSVDSSGVEANDFSQLPSISPDGHTIVFRSGADNLVPGDTNTFLDIFVSISDGCGSNIGTTYCTAGPNSTGAAAAISASGSAGVAANDLLLRAEPVPDQPGIFFYGPQQASVPFGNGTLCIAGQIGRLDIVNAAGNVMTFLLDNTSPPSAPTQITPGSTWNFQAWYRDPAAGGAFFDMSNGLNVVFGL